MVICIAAAYTKYPIIQQALSHIKLNKRLSQVWKLSEFQVWKNFSFEKHRMSNYCVSAKGKDRLRPQQTFSPPTHSRICQEFYVWVYSNKTGLRNPPVTGCHVQSVSNMKPHFICLPLCCIYKKSFCPLWQIKQLSKKGQQVSLPLFYGLWNF